MSPYSIYFCMIVYIGILCIIYLDVVEKVKLTQQRPYRPILPDISPTKHEQAARSLMMECWVEDPGDRPKMDEILIKLSGINEGR